MVAPPQSCVSEQPKRVGHASTAEGHGPYVSQTPYCVWPGQPVFVIVGQL